jgi:hypothetical protein
VTAVAGLVAGVTVSGLVGFAAAAVLWVFIPRRAPLRSRKRAAGESPVSADPPGRPAARDCPCPEGEPAES